MRIRHIADPKQRVCGGEMTSFQRRRLSRQALVRVRQLHGRKGSHLAGLGIDLFQDNRRYELSFSEFSLQQNKASSANATAATY